MKDSVFKDRRRSVSTLLMAILALLNSCHRSDDRVVQGYVEGEFVYVASPMAGALRTLFVLRGAQVQEGAPLFNLENGYEQAARDEAERKVAQAQANLDDVKTGQRPTELQTLQAQLDQARAALVLSQKEFGRQDALSKSGVASKQDWDRARSARDQDQQHITQLEATLETARLGAREQQIVAAEASLKAQMASLDAAEWSLSQKNQSSPKEGLVFDTLYREGDWVAAGKPVIVLLPPANIKVRAFVAQEKLGLIHQGDSVSVSVDGVTEAYEGRISYISPKSEFTPPVIYSQDMREKLVFLVEISFDPKVAAKLHPGQPVDARFKW
ncbi:MAG TPA: HlyD family efflux transporter periplasmic adaptor subunit [Chthoniobacterales bacterium]|jgi:HlyD family secretion protein|nr:HlyD family efflux transporter periplasmic adaptor subunit [Chthoniobacterales bacterium]